MDSNPHLTDIEEKGLKRSEAHHRFHKRLESQASWPGEIYNCRNTLATSFDGNNLRHKSRCWACRTLYPFTVYPADDESLQAWGEGIDPEKMKEKECPSGRTRPTVLDPKSQPTCAEGMVAAADYAMRREGKEGGPSHSTGLGDENLQFLREWSYNLRCHSA